MHKLAILHTTPATIPSLKALCEELLPDTAVMNMLDDAVLGQLSSEPDSLGAVFERLLLYARAARLAGAQRLLLACSSIGGFAQWAKEKIDLTILRIDEPMAREAAARGKPIRLFATAATTLGPSLELIKRYAASPVRHTLLSGAFAHLQAGNRAQYEAAILEGVGEALATDCTVVLAQASMAGALGGLSDAERERVLTSPRLGIMAVAESFHQEEDSQCTTPTMR